jgi:hypothetical protein
MQAGSKRKPVEDEYVYEWYARGERGFNRELARCIDTYRLQLDCSLGSDSYWDSIKNEADKVDQKQPIVHVVTMLTRDTMDVIGFSIIRKGKICTERGCNYYDDAWYIEYICTSKGKGFGQQFMTQIHLRATELGIKNITLSALPYVITFYHNLGYRLTFDANCIENERISRLAQNVKDELKKRKALGQKIPTETEDLLAQEPFASLIIESLKRNLGSTQIAKRGCSSNTECAEDGFYMVICLQKREMTATNVFGEVFSNIPKRFAAREEQFDDEDTLKRLLAWKKDPNAMD